MKKIFPLLAATASLMLTACAKDYPYRTSHPDLGAVEVATDWSGKSSESEAPPVYTLRIGSTEHVVGGTTNVFGTLLAPGNYDLTAFSKPIKIGLSGNTATVESTDTDGYIAPDAGYLFAAYSRISVAADDTLHVTLPMIQYVRQLDIKLTATEGDYSRVVSATATLSGGGTCRGFHHEQNGGRHGTDDASLHADGQYLRDELPPVAYSRPGYTDTHR